MQDKEMEEITKKVLEAIEAKEDIGEKLLFINKIHSTKGSVSVRVSKVAFDMAKKICDEEGVSVNAYITTALATRIFEDLKSKG